MFQESTDLIATFVVMPVVNKLDVADPWTEVHGIKLPVERGTYPQRSKIPQNE